jgi:hypothetical protein
MLCVLAVSLSLVSSALGQACISSGVPRHQCIPFETLPPYLQSKADQLLVKLLDSEALYTVVGGLKPASDGFWHQQFPADLTTTPEIENTRQILSHLTCGSDLVAGVFVFDQAHDGKRSASAFVVHRPRLCATIRLHATVFQSLGIYEATPPQEVFERIDRGPRSNRWRAFGYIFGYPDYAVDFFVEAGERQTADGQFVKREFRSIPTWAGEHRFVYAVPLGHVDRAEDQQLRSLAEPILAEYKRRRGHYLGEGKPGAAYLLRDWFDDGTGCCRTSSLHATTIIHDQVSPNLPLRCSLRRLLRPSRCP